MDLTTCENIFFYAPACANTSWTLWNSTMEGEYGGFFCCEASMTGDTGGFCHYSGDVVSPSSMALLVGNYTRNSIFLNRSLLCLHERILTNLDRSVLRPYPRARHHKRLRRLRLVPKRHTVLTPRRLMLQLWERHLSLVSLLFCLQHISEVGASSG